LAVRTADGALMLCLHSWAFQRFIVFPLDSLSLSDTYYTTNINGLVLLQFLPLFIPNYHSRQAKDKKSILAIKKDERINRELIVKIKLLFR